MLEANSRKLIKVKKHRRKLRLWNSVITICFVFLSANCFYFLFFLIFQIIAGIFFLSGGQSEEMATDNLRALNQLVNFLYLFIFYYLFIFPLSLSLALYLSFNVSLSLTLRLSVSDDLSLCLCLSLAFFCIIFHLFIFLQFLLIYPFPRFIYSYLYLAFSEFFPNFFVDRVSETMADFLLFWSCTTGISCLWTVCPCSYLWLREATKKVPNGQAKDLSPSPSGLIAIGTLF